MEDDHESVNDFDSTRLLCEEHCGKDGEQPYSGETAKGQKGNRKGLQEETEREKRVQERKKEIEEKVVEQQLQVVAANTERKREGEDLDGGKPSSFFLLEDEEEPGVPPAESGCPMGLLTVCEQEDFFNVGLPTDGSSSVAQPFCPWRIQQPRPQKRPHSSSPTSEAPPLLPLESTEPSPSEKPPSKVVSLGEFPPLQVKFTRVYTTRRYKLYTARGQGAFLQYPGLPVGGGVGEGNEALRLEEPTDPALLPPKPKRKMRTFYSTDQREELERLFQDDRYPDSVKQKEIAGAIAVTPQRIMVWFQNRRAKWRKVEKTSGRPERRQNLEGRGHLQICAPQPREVIPSVQASRLTPQPSQTLPHFNTILPNYPSLTPQPSQTLHHYNTILPNYPSPTGGAVGGDVGQQSPGSAVDHLPPVMLSPPPLRRASLPLLTSYFPPNHLAPLLLDTPESSFTMPHPDSAGKESRGTSSSLFDYSETMGKLNRYPQQHSSLVPASSLSQYSRLSYLAPSSSLAPTPPDSNPPSYLLQLLLQSGVHHGGTSAFQACPWSDMYGQTSRYPPGVYHCAQYVPSGGPGLVSAQHYIQMQKPGAGPGQTVFQPVQRGSVAPLPLPPAFSLHPQYQNPQRGDRTLPSTRMGHDPAAVEPTPEPNQSQPPDTRTNQSQAPDTRNSESDAAFSCDFSPIFF